MQNAKCKLQNANCDVRPNPSREENVSEIFWVELQTHFFSYQKLDLRFAFCILHFAYPLSSTGYSLTVVCFGYKSETAKEHISILLRLWGKKLAEQVQFLETLSLEVYFTCTSETMKWSTQVCKESHWTCAESHDEYADNDLFSCSKRHELDSCLSTNNMAWHLYSVFLHVQNFVVTDGENMKKIGDKVCFWCARPIIVGYKICLWLIVSLTVLSGTKFARSETKVCLWCMSGECASARRAKLVCREKKSNFWWSRTCVKIMCFRAGQARAKLVL